MTQEQHLLLQLPRSCVAAGRSAVTEGHESTFKHRVAHEKVHLPFQLRKLGWLYYIKMMLGAAPSPRGWTSLVSLVSWRLSTRALGSK